MQCQGPGCTKEVQQVPGGHRARKYCSDICRVAAHRKHAEEVKDAARKVQATLSRRAAGRMSRSTARAGAHER